MFLTYLCYRSRFIQSCYKIVRFSKKNCRKLSNFSYLVTPQQKREHSKQRKEDLKKPQYYKTTTGCQCCSITEKLHTSYLKNLGVLLIGLQNVLLNFNCVKELYKLLEISLRGYPLRLFKKEKPHFKALLFKYKNQIANSFSFNLCNCYWEATDTVLPFSF